MEWAVLALALALGFQAWERHAERVEAQRRERELLTRILHPTMIPVADVPPDSEQRTVVQDEIDLIGTIQQDPDPTTHPNGNG